MSRRLRVFIAIALVALLTPTVARADDDVRFRRTTPRAALDERDHTLVIGIPGGRAWGIESELRALPPAGTTLVVRLAVSDDAVREAFVRIAYYGRAPVRSRQLAVLDSAPVPAGGHALVALTIEPPSGAVAYRVRVLARLADPHGRSAADAVSARLRIAHGSARPAGSLASRLLP